jgi:aspartokinase
MFAATAEAGIDLHMISTSISTVSCVINEDQFDAALAKLRERFLVP